MSSDCEVVQKSYMRTLLSWICKMRAVNKCWALSELGLKLPVNPNDYFLNKLIAKNSGKGKQKTIQDRTKQNKPKKEEKLDF